ncbi:hypothetical protein BH11ACT8_BH11ACT8_23550 [soil metagenome]
MRRVLPAAVALAAAAAVFVTPVQTSTAAPASPSSSQGVAARVVVNQKGLVKTPYVFGASGYGTLVRGASVPAGSSQTGYMVMGCNRLAGKTRSNFIAGVDVPGLGTINGVRTRLLSRKVGNKYSAISTHTIAGVDLVDTALGSLSISAVKTTSEAFHQGGRYRAKNSVSVAKIILTPPGGLPPVNLGIPAPSAPIVVPGLLKINIAKQSTDKGSDFSVAKATGLRITVIPTKTTVILGATRARLDESRTRGVFNGYGAGVEARLLDGIAEVGRTALQPLGCTGTDGEDLVKSLASADLSPLAQTGDVAGGANGKITKRGFIAKTAGVVADVSLLSDALQVSVAVGTVNVRRSRNGKLFRNSKGSHVGTITANGQTYDLDALGKVEIPGIAKLEGPVVEKTRNGLKVIGLRVTALDGTLAVIDLGVAKAQVRPSTKKK